MFQWFKNFIRDHKAQITITGLLGFFTLLVVLIALLPTIDGVIVNATSGPNATITGETEIVLLRLIPLFMVISVFGSLFVYMRPQYG